MIKKIMTMFVVSSACLSNSSFANDSDWTLAREDDGITAYTQFSEELGYNAVKFETVVNVPVSTLVSFNTEPENFNQWMDSFNEVEILKRDNWYDYHLYVTYDFPFPYQNRDSISHTTVFKRSNGSVVVKFVGEATGKPMNADFVRMYFIV